MLFAKFLFLYLNGQILNKESNHLVTLAGNNPVKNFIVNLCYARSKHSDWLKSCKELTREFLMRIIYRWMFFKFIEPWINHTFLKNVPTSVSFHLFSSFHTHISNFTTNKCEKCPSSIWCRDSNSRPFEHESPPITTRAGLPPTRPNCFSWYW